MSDDFLHPRNSNMLYLNSQLKDGNHRLRKQFSFGGGDMKCFP